MRLRLACFGQTAFGFTLSTLRDLRSGAPIDLTFAHLAASFDVPSDQANSLL